MILLAMGLRLMLFSWIVNLVASNLYGADEFPALIDATPFFPQLDGFRIRRWIVGLSDFCKNMFIYLGFTIEIGWNILLYNMYDHLDIYTYIYISCRIKCVYIRTCMWACVFDMFSIPCAIAPVPTAVRFRQFGDLPMTGWRGFYCLGNCWNNWEFVHCIGHDHDWILWLLCGHPPV